MHNVVKRRNLELLCLVLFDIQTHKPKMSEKFVDLHNQMFRGFALLVIAIALLGLSRHLDYLNFWENENNTNAFPHAPPNRPAKVLK